MKFDQGDSPPNIFIEFELLEFKQIMHRLFIVLEIQS